MYKNILIYNILCKTFISVNPLSIIFGEKDGLINNFDGIRYLYYLVEGDMMQFKWY